MVLQHNQNIQQSYFTINDSIDTQPKKILNVWHHTVNFSKHVNARVWKSTVTINPCNLCACVLAATQRWAQQCVFCNR